MDDRQHSKRVNLGISPQAQPEQDETQGWPGKRALTDRLSGSSGGALPNEMRANLEGSLGSDLSGVRVHTDSQAGAAAEGLHARAFTVGQSIYFGRGQYDPGSSGGQRLIAHEVAHTVQQRGASGSPQLESLDVSTPGDRHETEAESFAQSFIAAPGARGKAVTPVSTGVIARAVIQRDLHDGTPPAGMGNVAPVNAQEADPSEISSHTRTAIRDARSSGGTNAVLAMVRRLRAGESANTRGPIENAIGGELTAEEKTAMSGGGNASGAANAPGGSGSAGAASQNANNAAANRANQSTTANANANSNANGAGGGGGAAGAGGANAGGANANANANANAAGAGGAAGGANANADAGGAGGAGGAVAGGAGGAGGAVAGGAGGAGGAAAGGAGGAGHAAPAGGAGGAGGAAAGPEGHAGAQGAGGAAPAHAGGEAPAGEGAAHHEVSAAGGRELIEQELSFHETWRSYSQNGALGRAGHLGMGMLFGNNGQDVSAGGLGGGDLAQGLLGGATQFGMGLGAKLIATRTIASRVPGVGNIIGGAFSAYALFSNGGAGIKKMGHEAIEGIGGAFNAQNWRESPWLTAANLVAGIKATLELVGHVCNVLSGLAYAFAAIAAVGGLLSVLFPPLAFLVPYIPVAVNFGRACGGIATVCLGVANLIAPIPPVLRAIHLIFSDNDPIRLVGDEKAYHESVQSAIATYSSNRASAALAAHTTGQPQRGFIAGTVHEIGEGAATTRSATSAGAVANTAEAMGQTRSGNPQQQGRNYFNPDGNHAIAEAQQAKAEKKLDAAQANSTAQEHRADRAQARLDANPTQRNFEASASASATAERLEGVVQHQEHQVGLAETRAEMTNVHNPDNVGGSTGDAADAARGRATENYRQPGEHAREESAGEAYRELREGQPEAEATRNARGHIVLPEPPGSLQEIEAIDHRIEELRHQQESIRATTAEARQVQATTTQQAAGLRQSAQGAQAHVAQNTARSQAAQGRVQGQTADMQARTGQANSQVSGGANQSTAALAPIASAAHTVDGFLGRVPSNRFFDVSGTKNNVHQFVVGMDTIMGVGGQQGAQASQANAAVQARNQHVNEARSANAAAAGQGATLVTTMNTDAATAQTASAQAATVAAEGASQGQAAAGSIQQLTAQRQQKWQALLSWAATHRSLREQGARAEH